MMTADVPAASTLVGTFFTRQYTWPVVEEGPSALTAVGAELDEAATTPHWQSRCSQTGLGTQTAAILQTLGPISGIGSLALTARMFFLLPLW